MNPGHCGSEETRVMPGPLEKVRLRWQQEPESGPRQPGMAIIQMKY